MRLAIRRFVAGGDLPGISTADGSRVGEIHDRTASGHPARPLVRGRESPPLREATSVPPLLQVQVHFGALDLGQKAMGRTPGPGFHHQTKMRQAHQIQDKTDQRAAVQIRQDNHRAARVMAQRVHQLVASPSDPIRGHASNEECGLGPPERAATTPRVTGSSAAGAWKYGETAFGTPVSSSSTDAADGS
ncbi:hypothetical protein ACIGWV_08215 [Streptomyces sp. NPDC055082]|uniref:hypothetical protein n=1 Tax=Streptomyces sp. NPDC055082 TaxID=3365718 RepID=UPI0037D60978